MASFLGLVEREPKGKLILTIPDGRQMASSRHCTNHLIAGRGGPGLLGVMLLHGPGKVRPCQRPAPTNRIGEDTIAVALEKETGSIKMTSMKLSVK